MKNWLEGIEQLDNEIEFASKNEENDDLSWLTASNEETPNFLEGIEKLEAAESSPLMKSFVRQGILEIAKKKAEGKQLSQSDMRILNDFHRSFPNISIEELEEAANAI